MGVGRALTDEEKSGCAGALDFVENSSKLNVSERESSPIIHLNSQKSVAESLPRARKLERRRER